MNRLLVTPLCLAFAFAGGYFPVAALATVWCECVYTPCWTYGPDDDPNPYPGYCCKNEAGFEACEAGHPALFDMVTIPNAECGDRYHEQNNACTDQVCTNCCGKQWAFDTCVPPIVASVEPQPRYPSVLADTR